MWLRSGRATNSFPRGSGFIPRKAPDAFYASGAPLLYNILQNLRRLSVLKIDPGNALVDPAKDLIGNGAHTDVETLVKCYDKKGEFLFEFPYFTETIISPEDTNNVFVLDKELGITAEINNLAKVESIYSARYLDDYGYFVTYEETDPLFTIDFSDMENPKIIGELKMPGYSEYLHFYGPNKLLGFGLEESSTWRNPDKLKLEMFNVEHGKAKKEAKTLLDKYSYSLSMYNYKALMVDPKRNLIGFAAEEEIISKYDWDYKQYYVVYSYQNKSFEELYRIKITKNAYDVRGFYIGDYLYIVCPEYGIYSINMKTYNKNEKVEYVHFK